MTKEENEKRIERLKNIVLNMPDKPGSYQFYDADHTIIYVGKAKRLKQRVSSYFHKEVDRFKTKVLVSKIEDISYTVVNTEEDALLEALVAVATSHDASQFAHLFSEASHVG
jgi:excinuclease ABC subunit C